MRTKVRLAVMMFLQSATWGAWAPVLGKHLANLGFNPVQIGGIYATGAIATVLSPLVAGQIADRWFSTDRFLAVAFASSAVLLRWAAVSTDYGAMWWTMFASMLAFAPTLGLANSLAFHHLEDPERAFPQIRVLGTVGWIAAGLALSGWMTWTGRPIGDCLNLAALLSAVNAGYALLLPRTPPARDAAEKFAVGKVLRMLRDPSFALFCALAFILMMFATFYYFRAANYFPAIGFTDAQLPLVMGIGQAMEIVTMLVLPAAYAWLGPKRTIALGAAAWAGRFALYAVGTPATAMMGQALHGICFGFGGAAVLIYVERISPPDVRGSVQSLLAWLTYGVGITAGALLSGYVSSWAHEDWRVIWTVPAVGCAVVLGVFLLGFTARDAPLADDPRTTAVS